MYNYFIIDINEEGWTMGKVTNNLQKDFIEYYDITFDTESSKNRYGAPNISNVQVGKANRVCVIFDMSNPESKIKPKLGEFNFFTEDYYDDLEDFLMENWRDIELNIDESVSIKKFKDFDRIP